MTDCEDAFDRLLSSSNTNTVCESTKITNGGNNSNDSDSEDEIVRSVHTKKAILDDFSDEDTPVIFKKGILNFCDDEDKETKTGDAPIHLQSEDEDIGQKKKSTKRINKLLDDSEDESTGADSFRRSPSLSRDARSDHSDSDSSVKSHRPSGSSKSGRRTSGSPHSSSGEESEVEVSIEAIKSKIINKHNASKSSKLLTESDTQDPEKKWRSKPKKEKAPSRKAKEAALAEIHSETQRMIRERQISLPYHKPKQRSLADFLNRRKFAPTVRLKTTSDELAKVWKHAEEREKAAELFYRSESDEETDKKDCNKNESAASTEATLIPSESTGTSEDTSCNGTTADRLQGVLIQHVASISQPMDSEEFPHLQLSDILVEPENTANVNSLENSDAVEENDGSLKLNPPNVEGAKKCLEAVTADTTNDIDSAPSTDIESLENSESALQSSILDDSIPLSGFSQNSLSEKINSLHLPIPNCPKISGAPDEVIDLDELSTKPGAFGLMQRFIKHSKFKSKPAKEHNVLSVMTSEVDDRGDIINLSEETIKVNKTVEPKPGERLVVLKTTLQQKMAENRGQQLAKRFEEYKLYEEEFYGVEQAEGEEDVLSEDESCGKEENEEKYIDEDKDIDNPFLEYEADESENEERASDVEDEKGDVNENAAEDGEKSDAEETASLDGDSDEESEVEKDDSNTVPVSENEEDDENEVLPTLIPAAFHSLVGTQHADIDETQLMALCSGNFSSSTIDLKVLETSSEGFQNTEDGESLGTRTKELTKHDVLDSDDEEIVVSKKQKAKQRKLSFSDDEGSTKDNDEPLCELDDDDGMKLTLNDDEAIEPNEEFDSDEEKQGQQDLIEEDEDDEEVQLAKKLSKGFLDKEAELSESEWGSEDEDEKGLDQYEEEEGDKEKISQRRLQKELGKIHMREVLADDNREIRILQELLLEDGDLHSDGPKRQRLFRWYNQDEDNPGDKRPLDLGENANENDEEDEESWRRHRLERENFLRKKKIDNLELETVHSPVNFSDTRKGMKITPKVTPNTNKSPDPKSNFSIFSKRGSFLARGEKMLSKLAEITNNAGTKENACGNSRNNRNMVFSVVSPPKEQPNEELKPEAPLKRKGGFIATSMVKKIKFTRSNGNKVSALDQLKLFEST